MYAIISIRISYYYYFNNIEVKPLIYAQFLSSSVKLTWNRLRWPETIRNFNLFETVSLSSKSWNLKVSRPILSESVCINTLLSTNLGSVPVSLVVTTSALSDFGWSPSFFCHQFVYTGISFYLPNVVQILHYESMKGWELVQKHSKKRMAVKIHSSFRLKNIIMKWNFHWTFLMER